MSDTLDSPALPPVVDRATWQAERDALLVREKAHWSSLHSPADVVIPH